MYDRVDACILLHANPSLHAKFGIVVVVDGKRVCQQIDLTDWNLGTAQRWFELPLDPRAAVASKIICRRLWYAYWINSLNPIQTSSLDLVD
jgi:hypothetical protein